MTKDQKQVLQALALLAGFKLIFYMSIHYAAKTAREAEARQRATVNQ